MFSVANGLRIVSPQYHSLEVRAKGRWFGRTVLDVLCDEFRARDETHYLKQINDGHIQLIRNETIISGNEIVHTGIENKDVIKLRVHKHEPPVLNFDRIEIIHQNDELVVIDKPCSIPVHPTGKFYHNSITEILKRQLNISEIYSCHRLDKLTSGLLILTKNSTLASSIQSKFKQKDVSKTYFARVNGKFPNTINLNRPIRTIDTKLGFINGVRLQKDAITEFKLFKYNPQLDQSIVICKPITGRTHQIRIHLNMLGYPIINDPLYGPNGSQLRSELIKAQDIPIEQFNQLLDEDMTRLNNLKKNSSKCEECEELLFDYEKIDNMIMWLHCYKLHVDDELKFETEPPEWCNI